MATGEDGLRFRASQNAKNDEKNDPVTSSGPTGVNSNPLWTHWQHFSSFSATSDANGSAQTGSPAPDFPRRFRTAHEYAVAVQQWTWQCQMWNSMNWFYMTSFPMYMMNMMTAQQWQQQQQQHTAGHLPGNFPVIGPGGAAVVGGGAAGAHTPAARQLAARPVHAQAVGDQNNNADIGIRYRIPSLWKRVAAEFIDFFVLFVIKLAVTILTVEYVGIVDIQKYDLDLLLSQNIDYNTAFAMTSELIAMEIINRIFICIFETLCLRKGVGGQVGGTTPGKSLMGLRVVLCEQIYDGPGLQMVRVLPASDIGLWNALMRSVIKNFSLAFFFPVCFTVFFFQHNRAAYDIISNCIVVESAT